MDSWPIDFEYSLPGSTGSSKKESSAEEVRYFIEDGVDEVDYFLDLLLRVNQDEPDKGTLIKIPVELEPIVNPASPRAEEVFDVIRPKKRYWVGPIDEYHCGLFFTPLAVTSLVTSVLVALYGVRNLQEIVSDGVVSWSESADMVVALFKLACASLALIGVAFRWTLGIHAQIIGLHVLMVSSLLNALLKCIEWSNAYRKDDWIPSSDEKIFMVKFYIVLVLVLTIIPMIILGPLLSLYKVMDNGGSGWEYKNYLQVIWDLQLAEVIAKKYRRTDKSTSSAGMIAPPFKLLETKEQYTAGLLESVKETLNQIERGRRIAVW